MSEKQQMIAALKDPSTVKKAVDEIFKKVDTDKSGFIESGELEVALTGLAKDLNIPKPSKKDIDDSMKALDANNDGKISKKELQPLIEALFQMLIAELEK